MARKIAVIQQQIIDSKNADPNLAGLDSPSQTAVWLNWSYIVAVAINLLEQILDIFTFNTETLVNNSIPGTPAWLRSEVLKFQYSSTDPQVVVINNDFSVGYAVENDQLRIVTRASVKQGANNIVNVKVAKSEPPQPLASLEQTALKAYLDTIGFAGVQTNIVSIDPDRLYIQANIYYNGQYSSTIQANVIAALTDYMTNLSSADNFDGIIKVSAIEDTIQKVLGVTDVQILSVKGRISSVPFSLATNITRTYETFAGYIVQEDTSGQTFSDSLNFIIE